MGVKLPPCPRCGSRRYKRTTHGGPLQCAACSLQSTPLLTVAEAAEYAEVSERTVTSWIRADMLVAIPEHRHRLVRLDHLMAIIERRAARKLPTRLLDKEPPNFR